MEREKPRVMLIGHGVIGAAHYRNLKLFEDKDELTVSSVVDIREERLTSLPEDIASVNLESSLEQVSPDIVAVATNTETHAGVIQKVVEKAKPALFIEKPFTATVESATRLANELRNAGYERHIPVSFMYLIRESPALQSVIDGLQAFDVDVTRVEATWQKLRKTTRPSAGIHIDESTHAIDAVVNHVLPAIGKRNDTVIVYKANKLFDPSVVDIAEQRRLYGENPDRLVPMAQLEYGMLVDDVVFEGKSSYLKEPIERSITFIGIDKRERECRLTAIFDKERTHQCEMHIDGKRISHDVFLTKRPELNGIYKEWASFLSYFRTGEKSSKQPSLSDAVFDVAIVESFDTKNLSVPYTIKRG